MRVMILVGSAMLGLTASLAAQHGRSYEFGMFGAYTRYNSAFGLPNRIGGGVRLGYLFNDLVELEAEVVFPSEYTVPPASTKIDPIIAGGSLVFNLLHGERNILYILGGYSRLDFGTTSPYHFSDNAAHGAIGDRIFLSHKAALRLEVRAVYTPSTQSTFTTNAVTHIVGTVGLAILAPSGNARTPRPAPPTAPTAAPVESTPPMPTPPLLLQDADGDGVPDRDDGCPGTPAGVTVDVRGCPLDADKDGVPDVTDQCPNTPLGAVVDGTGCAADADKDGVPDGLDKCPDTPAGATVDSSGCPSDSDRDGVLDGIDRCPDTAAGTAVDAVGCTLAAPAPPAPDADGDGVPDTLDKCPNSPKGVPVDANGCMILFQPTPETPAAPGAPAAPAAPRPTLILAGVNFQSGRSVLTASSYATLDQVAASLVANPEIRIEIAGYTDSIGTVAANIRLSQARAAAVRFYLARKGVSPARMLARGYGARSPIAPNATAQGRAQNRRVELHKLP